MKGTGSRPDDLAIVLITAGSEQEASRIATHLVEEHLAACVNIVGPIRSIYRWEGKIHHDEERLLIVKAATKSWAQLEKRVRELHSYQTPELIALPLAAASAAYLAWWREAVRA